MASTGGWRWSMHTFDAISEDEAVREARDEASAGGSLFTGE